MPVPFFWICMGITTVAIGAMVAYEAHIRYTQFREEQEYRHYARQYAQNHPPPPPPPKENDSGDEEDKDEENKIKHFVRSLNDNSELRHRLPRSESSLLTTTDVSQGNSRPVSDQKWVDDTDYELNEMERKLTEKKQDIERQQELLDKAEMDLEQRWQQYKFRSSELLEEMSSSSSAFVIDHQQHDNSHGPSTSSSSSFLSKNTSIQKQPDYEISKETTSQQYSTPSYTSSTNDHVTTISSTTTSAIQNISNSMDDSVGRLTATNDDDSQERLSTSFVSAPPSSLQSSIITTDNNTTTTSSQQQQQQTSDSSLGLNAEDPWSFEEDDDDDVDEDALSSSFRISMRLPNSNLHPSSSSESQHDSTDWDEQSLANDVLSLSSHATNSTLENHDSNSLVSPSSPSSVGSSYESVHGSDLENGS